MCVSKTCSLACWKKLAISSRKQNINTYIIYNILSNFCVDKEGSIIEKFFLQAFYWCSICSSEFVILLYQTLDANSFVKTRNQPRNDLEAQNSINLRSRTCILLRLLKPDDDIWVPYAQHKLWFCHSSSKHGFLVLHQFNAHIQWPFFQQVSDDFCWNLILSTQSLDPKVIRW